MVEVVMVLVVRVLVVLVLVVNREALVQDLLHQTAQVVETDDDAHLHARR